MIKARREVPAALRLFVGFRQLIDGVHAELAREGHPGAAAGCSGLQVPGHRPRRHDGGGAGPPARRLRSRVAGKTLDGLERLGTSVRHRPRPTPGASWSGSPTAASRCRPGRRRSSTSCAPSGRPLDRPGSGGEARKDLVTVTGGRKSFRPDVPGWFGGALGRRAPGSRSRCAETSSSARLISAAGRSPRPEAPRSWLTVRAPSDRRDARPGGRGPRPARPPAARHSRPSAAVATASTIDEQRASRYSATNGAKCGDAARESAGRPCRYLPVSTPRPSGDQASTPSPSASQAGQHLALDAALEQRVLDLGGHQRCPARPRPAARPRRVAVCQPV